MKTTTLARILTLIALVSMTGALLTTADAAERRRGVTPPAELSGIVLTSSMNTLELRNESGDHTLHVTMQTRVQGDLHVGVQAQARYVEGSNGEKMAVSLHAKREVIELRGVIHALTDTGFVLLTGRGEVGITIDDNTIVVIGGAVATSGELAVGDRVEIHALPSTTGEGSLLALLVVAETENIELHGAIAALTDTSLTLRSARGEIEIGLTPETVVRIYGREGTLADLAVGQHVEIDAERALDGSLVAIVVKVEHDYDLLEVHGVVAAVSATELTVIARHGEEITFAILPDTIILRRGEPITAADIAVGDLVEVKAVRDGEGGLAAVRIKVEDHEHEFREIEGIIAGVEGSLLTITLRDGSTVTVLINSLTMIRVERGMGSVADLVPGQKVEVHVFENDDGSLVAIVIKVEVEDHHGGDDDHDFEIHGMVTALGDASITIRTRHVGDLVFLVNDATVVTRGDMVISFSEIRIGDIVEIDSVSDAEGVLTAVKIEVETMGDGMEVEIEGEVTAVATTSITLMTSRGAETFNVTSETEISIDDHAATIGDILVGDHAEVKAKMRMGTYTAVRIEIEREHD